MKQRRNTLAGTPTAIAPGALFLVGEFRLPGEEVTVLAALSRHARAQYFPDVAAPSPLVAAAVEHAHRYLGESAAALPAGSVLLRRPEAGEDGQAATFETTAAIAVATVAAVFEMAGQSLNERRDEILVVAEAAHRAAYAGIGAEGELAAALYGGLIKVVIPAGAAPRTEALAPPAGLHLVVFHTGSPVFPLDWLSRLHQFAERDGTGYALLTSDLREHAARFAAELSAGIPTTAIVSAGRYGNCLSQLVVASSSCVPCAPFLRAVELAKENGGIAKTTNAGHGDFGVAMFATRQAADGFVAACQPPLVPLGLELDRCGVSRLVSSQTGESAAVPTPVPEIGPSSVSAEAIVRPVEDAVTEKQNVEMGTLGGFPVPPAMVRAEQSSAVPHANQMETLGGFPVPSAPRSPCASPPAPVPVMLEAEARPLAQEKTQPGEVFVQHERPQRPRKSAGRRLAIVGALFMASFLAVSLGKTLARREATPVTSPGVATLPVPSVQPPPVAEPPSEEAAPPVAPFGGGEALPAKAHASAARFRGSVSDKPSGKAPTLAPPDATPSPRRSTAAPPTGTPTPAPRAGKLSADDF